MVHLRLKQTNFKNIPTPGKLIAPTRSYAWGSKDYVGVYKKSS